MNTISTKTDKSTSDVDCNLGDDICVTMTVNNGVVSYSPSTFVFAKGVTAGSIQFSVTTAGYTFNCPNIQIVQGNVTCTANPNPNPAPGTNLMTFNLSNLPSTGCTDDVTLTFAFYSSGIFVSTIGSMPQIGNDGSTNPDPPV